MSSQSNFKVALAASCPRQWQLQYSIARTSRLLDCFACGPIFGLQCANCVSSLTLFNVPSTFTSSNDYTFLTLNVFCGTKQATISNFLLSYSKSDFSYKPTIGESSADQCLAASVVNSACLPRYPFIIPSSLWRLSKPSFSSSLHFAKPMNPREQSWLFGCVYANRYARGM